MILLEIKLHIFEEAFPLPFQSEGGNASSKGGCTFILKKKTGTFVSLTVLVQMYAALLD